MNIELRDLAFGFCFYLPLDKSCNSQFLQVSAFHHSIALKPIANHCFELSVPVQKIYVVQVVRAGKKGAAETSDQCKALLCYHEQLCYDKC